eukprot:scaffold59694_cov31-Tisochrysis_lutea.AAC.4
MLYVGAGTHLFLLPRTCAKKTRCLLRTYYLRSKKSLKILTSRARGFWTPFGSLSLSHAPTYPFFRALSTRLAAPPLVLYLGAQAVGVTGSSGVHLPLAVRFSASSCAVRWPVFLSFS